MEFTFGYDVEAEGNINVSSVTFKEELTREQEERLIASYKTGKYYKLDEDDSIADIYDMIRGTAIRLEEQQEYGNLIGTELQVTNFRYPEELR